MLAIYFEIKGLDVQDSSIKYNLVYNFITKTLNGIKVDSKTKLFFANTKSKPVAVLEEIKKIAGNDVKVFVMEVQSYAGSMSNEFWEIFETE